MRTQEFWTDENGNRWNKEKFTEQEAEKASKSLKGCEKCEDCINCVDCIYCVQCKNCHTMIGSCFREGRSFETIRDMYYLTSDWMQVLVKIREVQSFRH